MLVIESVGTEVFGQDRSCFIFPDRESLGDSMIRTKSRFKRGTEIIRSALGGVLMGVSFFISAIFWISVLFMGTVTIVSALLRCGFSGKGAKKIR